MKHADSYCRRVGRGKPTPCKTSLRLRKHLTFKVNSQNFNKHLLLVTELLRRTLWEIKPTWKWKVFSLHWIATVKTEQQKGSTAFALKLSQNHSWKSFSFSLNCDFQKRSTKGPAWLELWKQSQNYSWKSFSFSLNCDFQKKCESKVKMKVESSFHFRWIATFKKDH